MRRVDTGIPVAALAWRKVSQSAGADRAMGGGPPGDVAEVRSASVSQRKAGSRSAMRGIIRT